MKWEGAWVVYGRQGKCIEGFVETPKGHRLYNCDKTSTIIVQHKLTEVVS